MAIEKQTPCQARGYRIGDHFEVVASTPTFRNGSKIELCEDDGSTCPKFILLAGKCTMFGSPHKGKPASYCSLSKVVKVGKLQIEPVQFPPLPNVFSEASGIVYGDREEVYGRPAKNLKHIAEQWELYLRQKYGNACTISAEDVCYMMADLKKCRQINSPKRDNLVDGIGYIGLIERL